MLEKLDKVFACPFLRIGTVVCCICDAHYSTKIHHLTEAIDIYSEWIDECERVNNEEEEVF
ncbi:hypothetical protein MKW92_044170 [Papaver armeniacum]|nr:hypothetical protein MKW92_044170 [Papaver armeniacum]